MRETKTARQVWEPFGHAELNLIKTRQVLRFEGTGAGSTSCADYTTIVPRFLRDDFLCYNILMERNYSALLEKSLSGLRLELLRLLAYQAVVLRVPLYLVGGVVRDVLLGRPANDFDLVVEGNAAALAELVLKKHGGKILTNSRFGTAKWILTEETLNRLGFPFLRFPDAQFLVDLISARSETYSRPGALPTIKLSTIQDDLMRRDFTINAMALRLDGEHFGELFDPMLGQQDLERGLIRVLHSKSFVDDPTRIMRGVRYAVRYGFEIDRETLALINDESRGVLSELSGERLRHEFDLVFEEEDSSAVLKRLAEVDVLRPIHHALMLANHDMPSIENPGPEFGEFAVPDILTLRQALCWTLWLMSLPVSEIDSIAARLDFPALLIKTLRAASTLLAGIPSLMDWKPSQWTFHLDNLPALAVYAVYLSEKESALYAYLVKWRHVKPFTTGDDLKQRGLEPGPRYAEILRRLRAAWLDGEVGSKAEEEKRLLEEIS